MIVPVGSKGFRSSNLSTASQASLSFISKRHNSLPKPCNIYKALKSPIHTSCSSRMLNCSRVVCMRMFNVRARVGWGSSGDLFVFVRKEHILIHCKEGMHMNSRRLSQLMLSRLGLVLDIVVCFCSFFRVKPRLLGVRGICFDIVTVWVWLRVCSKRLRLHSW